MEKTGFNRRNFLAFIPAISLMSLTRKSIKDNPFPVSCNVYNWFTFYRRAGMEWGKNLEKDIADFAKTGIQAFEPSIIEKDFLIQLIPLLKQHDIQMPSIYVNSVLHEEEAIDISISSILEIAEIAKTYGTKIIVTNPSPIEWGTGQVKNDTQLIIQAKAMERLGSELRKMGLTLAYHTHDVELKAGAREFHHMLVNTSPENVSFCFDIHWVYRGSENSQVAVFDILKMYGDRIIELHVRQSLEGIWSEVFTAEGDIDYKRFSRELAEMKVQPLIVIEQCLEAKSPETMDAVQAHMKDLVAIKETFQENLK